MRARSDRGRSSMYRLLPAALGRLILVAALLPAALAHRPSLAQQSEDIPVVTRTFAVRDARIVQAPGQIIERGTVVLEDGLISAVGSDVTVPYDAEIIEGDSLTVYAGFVDGLSHTAIPTDEDENEDLERDEPVNRADPPDELAGIQPQRDAREMLDPADASVAALRRLGFTAAHVVPRGRMLPGSGSIILLTGDEPGEMVLRPDVSMFMTFEGGRGVYPATTMGVIATLRQLVRQARLHRSAALAYAENPTGMERPTFDPVHEAIYPVLSREKPLFVLADGENSVLEVHRALNLRDELDFSLVLAGLNQGFDVADDLQGAGVPLFVTLDLPDVEHEVDSTAADTTRAITPQEPATFFVSDLRTRSFEDVAREKSNLEARQALERERYYGTAARLREAGLRFGVTTMGAEKSDIRRNVRRMIDAGLSEDDALAALTIDGARLLGLDRSLGTVEAGKMANLVVTKGSYFDPESPVRYVFVDGRMYEYEGKPGSSSLAAVAGVWQLRIDTPDGTVSAELTLGDEGGEVTSDQLSAPSEIEDVELEGDRLSFSFDTEEYGRIAADFSVSGSTMTGTVTVPEEGTFEVTGTKPD